MTTTRQTMIWIAAFAAFLGLVLVFESILLPFLVGLAVAYFLDPVCDRLEEWGCSRTVATTIVTVCFFILVAIALAVLAPVLYRQFAEFVAGLPDLIARIGDMARPLIETVVGADPDGGLGIEKFLRESIGDAAKVLGAVLGRLASGLGALVNLVSLAVVTPVVAFYLLRDWDRLVATVDGWLPRDHVETIRAQATLVDETLAGFVRGQFMVCILLGVFYAIGLSIFGLPFGAVVGLATGLLSFIPYVGMLSGFAVGLGLALVHFDNMTDIGLIVAVFFVGQVIEGNFLTPKLVGERVNLHGVWIIFALMAGGAVFGFVGILLAVPVAAILGVLVRFTLDRYLGSRLYLGEGPGVEGDTVDDGPAA